MDHSPSALNGGFTVDQGTDWHQGEKCMSVHGGCLSPQLRVEVGEGLENSPSLGACKETDHLRVGAIPARVICQGQGEKQKGTGKGLNTEILKVSSRGI